MQLNKEEKKRLEKELEKWNANSKHYVSIEAIEDAMNWTPDYISPEDFKEIFKDLSDYPKVDSQSCTTVI